MITNGTHPAPSIRVAEASKIVENAQRDVNIAFVNEIAKICGAMGIDTLDVLEAASTAQLSTDACRHNEEGTSFIDRPPHTT